MRKLAAVVVILASLGTLGGSSAGSAGEPRRYLAVMNDDGGLAQVPLAGTTFAVSYRNSIYQTLAEERYEVLGDGSFRLVEIAADQLAVLEEYYAVPGTPVPADDQDRRNYVVPPNPDRPAVFQTLSIAATDLGQRTLHVPGEPPLELWELVGNDNPYVVLNIKETQ
ncbi:hypothetical protein GC088_13365 [Arthrobacter sp. JZ12]|uniref:hypothetical protein n=1 Tax=Arthrobacter sp. JZ12 TaxID=2654190 RepID=UPI002B4721C7|nr:hypothetical protein [Arthrobacter sp. JZ12]WRH25961.1 hypothetical protein GC088_13365 [Arthrobacter sp. JZ12]